MKNDKARSPGTSPQTSHRRWYPFHAPALLLALLNGPVAATVHAGEAPAGFDGRTNGLITQGDFDHDRELFERRETPASGLGPVYNAQSCAECHANPTSGGSSQVTALRAGRFDGERFIAPRGGSVVHDRATDASIQSRVPASANVTAARLSPSMLGAGFVEAIADETLQQIAKQQPERSRGAIHGQAVLVDVIEVPGAKGIGRFGWKSQHASLLSFNAEALRNEIGITNALFPDENMSNGRSVADFDTVPDPENNGWLVALMTEFVRATKAPPRDAALAATDASRAGEVLFDQIGCAICHVASITTAPAGTAINGGAFTLPAALGGKTIHPYSDYLLHDVGTGDGIVQNGGPHTRNKIRTAPLWGLRTRARLLHDGRAVTPQDAIERHQGESSLVAARFGTLSPNQKRQLIAFLRSL